MTFKFRFLMVYFLLLLLIHRVTFKPQSQMLTSTCQALLFVIVAQNYPCGHLPSQTDDQQRRMQFVGAEQAQIESAVWLTLRSTELFVLRYISHVAMMPRYK